ncbi:DNA cytosine methyltransferase [Agrobacterium deltaense]
MLQHANDNKTGLRYLSVCSGIEAATVAWSPLNWKAVAFSEIEKFPSAVLKHHYPDVPNLGDFTKIDTKTLGRVDVLAGGTPCQAFSVAGLRQSLADARGNLSLEFVRLAHELAANNGLRNIVWENVVGVLSTKDNAFGCFLAGLVGADDAVIPSEKPAYGKSNKHWKWRKGGRYAVLNDDGEKTGEFEVREPWHALSWPRHGMVSGPKGRAAWAVKDAQFFGVAQRRRRVLVVADFGNGADPAAVLFEPEGVLRYPPPSREEGKDVAPTISARTKGGGGLGTDFDLDGGLIEAAHPLMAKGNSSHDATKETYVPEIARCVATREGSSQDYETTTMVAVCVTGDVAHTLKAEGADASEDGTGRGTPIVAFVQNSRDEVRLMNGDGQIVGALAAEPGAKQQCYLAQSVAIRGRDGGATAELGGEVATALRASQGGGDKPHVLVDGLPETAGTMKACAQSGGFSNSADHAAAGYMVPVTTSAVRRLTPRECERLQGFQWLCDPTYPGAWQDEAGRWWSPDYTDIPWRGKANSPDGPRYKALGNSWAVPKFVWLGQRIQKLMPVANDNIAIKEAA